MTNYNDGKWHGWNGGECPVHPKTVVEVVYLFAGEPFKETYEASVWDWTATVDPVINFRVIKEHKVPREFWAINFLGYWREGSQNNEGAVLFREVLK